MSIAATRTGLIFDAGTFTETQPSIESHFICGKGLIDSRTVFLIMNRGRDCEFEDRLQRNTALHITRTIEQAAQEEAPLLYVQDQLGDPEGGFDTTRVITADLSTLLLSPSGMGRVSACLARFAQHHLMVSAILGPTSGPLALPLMLADLVMMTRKGALCMGVRTWSGPCWDRTATCSRSGARRYTAKPVRRSWFSMTNKRCSPARGS